MSVAIPRYVIRQSLAVRNRSAGFYANHQPGGIDLIDTSAYLNNVNFNLLCRDANNSKDIPNYNHKLINNLGYKGRNEVTNINRAACDLAANSFDLKLRLSDRNFHRLNESDLVQPRSLTASCRSSHS